MKKILLKYILFSITLYSSESISKSNLPIPNTQPLLIEKIEKLSITNHLKEAKVLTKNALKSYPENIYLHLLYAKLLYWSQDAINAKKEIEKYKKYNYKLYKKIYTSWAIKVLHNTKSSRKKLEFIKKLYPFAKNSYDIKWIETDSYIKLKKLKKALHSAKTLSKKYPKSQEANERVAQLLFWNGYYKKSLKKYKELTKRFGNQYLSKIKQLEKILNANSVALQSKTEKNKKAKKSKKKEFSSKKSLYIDKNHKSKYMIGIGFENRIYSDKRYKDNTKYLEAAFPIKDYTLYFKIQKTKRYNLEDNKLSLEFYPKLPSPFWGYISFSYTQDADFFSIYSIGWHQYYNIGNWQFGASYEFSRYNKEKINILSCEYVYYLNSYLFVREQLTYVLDNKSWAHLFQFKYQNPIHLEWYFNYTYSNSYEKFKNIYKHTIKNKIELGGEYPIGKHLSIGASITKSWFKSEYGKYSKVGSNLFIRYYW